MNNIDKGLQIAKNMGLEVPRKYMIKVIKTKEIKKKLISKWKRKKYKKKIEKNGKIKYKVYWNTFCGQYTSECLLKAGFDMEPILKERSLWNINTTMQYANALKSINTGDLIEVTPEQAFYLACIGRDALILSPKTMVVNRKPYNHAAVTWPIFTKKYDKEIGPFIAQQGWKALVNKSISDKYAWGENWTNPMVKYFLPGLK